MKNQKLELSTIIGKGCKVNGSLSIKGGIKVDGEIEGELESDNIVIVGNTGNVKASIKAAECIISGTVTGDVTVISALELEKTARIDGNIKAKTLHVHVGAIINGMCNVAQTSSEKK
ncbi:MAG: polymer-forming cytoskeletal protein [Candidatus Cloacimonetes bacterium]|nr:polymer-forming cytoskeletal protein [Candidatus Cloacimonadota bacterium]